MHKKRREYHREHLFNIIKLFHNYSLINKIACYCNKVFSIANNNVKALTDLCEK